jgi:hypothetical protein
MVRKNYAMQLVFRVTINKMSEHQPKIVGTFNGGKVTVLAESGTDKSHKLTIAYPSEWKAVISLIKIGPFTSSICKENADGTDGDGRKYVSFSGVRPEIFGEVITAVVTILSIEWPKLEI